MYILCILKIILTPMVVFFTGFMGCYWDLLEDFERISNIYGKLNGFHDSSCFQIVMNKLNKHDHDQKYHEISMENGINVDEPIMTNDTICGFV